MNSYQRRLPHQDSPGQPVFVTFRLHGTLPFNRPFSYNQLIANGKIFAAMDKLLDQSTTGPRYLIQPKIAELVITAIKTTETRFHRYQLHAFVVMPNHVHLLATPNVPFTKWLGPLKGITANQANQILGTQGIPFWQDESYDRLIRTDKEFAQVQNYIEQNPVKAGLAPTKETYPYSSAHKP